MNKILFLKGLPASGKSHFSKELVAKEPGKWVRVNKDSLRKQLHDGKWSKEREKVVERMHRAMAVEALTAGMSVIVDDTNFSPRHEATYREIAKNLGAEFEIKEFDTSVEECIERDNKRPDHVGKDVILRMFYESKCLPTRNFSDPIKELHLQLAVICDLDGTLALMRDRGPYEWQKVGNDEISVFLSCLLQLLHDTGFKILLVSGRDEICRKETEDWLKRHQIGYSQLWMRPKDSKEKDTVVKQRIYEENIKEKYNVRAVFDDRPCVVRFWRSQGLFVFDCGNGVEF